MRIAHFTNTYKPNINGVSRSVSTFREALTDLGHQVFIFAPGSGKYVDDEPYIFRFPAFEIPQFNYSISIPVSTYVNWTLPRLKPDVIHSNHPVLLGDIAANRAFKFDLPLVFTFHTRYTEYSHYVPLQQAFVKGVIVEGLARYLRKCQHIITPSASIQNILAEHGVDDRVTTIPTGIDLEPYRDADGRKIRDHFGWGNDRVLVSMGRLAREKNWETLLDACARVMETHADVRLLLIGDGPQRDELEKYASDLGIANRVTFVGRVPFESVPDHPKAGDLFCFASVTETQGLATMEALAAGLPVVAVDATGTRDVVEEGVDGLLTHNDSQALALAISRLLDDNGLRETFIANAREKVKQFDTKRQAKRLVEVYRQVIEDKKAGYTIRVESLKYT